jgi:hypothetical protein
MNQHKKLSAQQRADEQQLTVGQQQAQSTGFLEFATPEEMIRHDALHTPVPPAVAHRLQESIERLPAPPRSWWRRLFGA